MKRIKIFIAGHKGLVGSSLHNYLKRNNFKNIITATRLKLDLTDASKVKKFIRKKRPDVVINCAGEVGGIMANYTYPTEFLFENIKIQMNLMNSCFDNNIKNVILLGSSCIYPKFSKQPIREDYLLSGKLEETNEPYAVAKIAGIKMCQAYNKQYKTNYKCLMPANSYGPNDNYHLLNSHFFPALIHKAHVCKIKNKSSITVWGSGKPFRELVFVDDVADACIFFMNKKTKDTLINIGTGRDMSIKDYTKFILRKLDLKIKIKFNKSIPDGIYRKLLNISKAKKYGWKAKTTLDMGFDITYKNFKKKFKYLK